MLIRAGEQSRNLRGANPVAAQTGDCVGYRAGNVLDRHDYSGDDFPLCAPLDVQREAHVAVENFDLTDIGCECVQNWTRLDHRNCAHHANSVLFSQAGGFGGANSGIGPEGKLSHGVTSSSNHDDSCGLPGAAPLSRPNHVSVRLLKVTSRAPAMARQLPAETLAGLLFTIRPRTLHQAVTEGTEAQSGNHRSDTNSAQKTNPIHFTSQADPIGGGDSTRLLTPPPHHQNNGA